LRTDRPKPDKFGLKEKQVTPRESDGSAAEAADPFDELDRFLEPSERSKATHALAAFGERALPVLDALFSGEAKNHFGVRYADLGTGTLACGLVAATILGPIAKPLEPHLRHLLLHGHGEYAAAALGSLGSLETASVAALAAELDGNPLIAFEAAVALIACGAADETVVTQVRDASPRAAKCLEGAAEYVAKSERARRHRCS
jgi:hypothetical protein